MFRELERLVLALAATACATDPTEPARTPAPAAPSLGVVLPLGYQAAGLPRVAGPARKRAGAGVGSRGG